MKYYHIVSDGLYWSTARAAFVPHGSIPEGVDAVFEIADLPDQDELLVCLRFYGHPLGELAGPDEKAKQFEEAVARRLDEFAREKKYDNMDRARLAALTEDFKADGDCANRLYDQVWLAAFALGDQIRGGTLTVGEALTRLPAMRWPG